MLEYYKRKVLKEEADQVLTEGLELHLFENPLQTDVCPGDVLILDIYDKNPNHTRMEKISSWAWRGMGWFSGKHGIWEQFGDLEEPKPLLYTVDEIQTDCSLFRDRVDAFFEGLTDLQLADTDNILKNFLEYSRRRGGSSGVHPLAPWWVHLKFQAKDKPLPWGNELDFWLKLDSELGQETYASWQDEIRLFQHIRKLKGDLREAQAKITTNFMRA
jgi:hypothetical protein